MQKREIILLLLRNIDESSLANGFELKTIIETKNQVFKR